MRIAICLILLCLSTPKLNADDTFVEMVRADKPIAWWRFEEVSGDAQSEVNAELFVGKRFGAVQQNLKGPAGKAYPLMGEKNRAAFWGAGSFRVADPGEGSLLDFEQGDSITIEAWVNPEQLANDRQNYIVGKGRTYRNGKRLENQNYALRVRGVGGTARLSFLFRSAGDNGDYHRWNSTRGMHADGYWHHVAVSYEFGKPESIRGYLDGQPTDGTWDLGGATNLPPVVDNDELWIGSAMAQSSGNTFEGGIDEVAIYRGMISIDRLKQRYEFHEELARTPVEPPESLTSSDIAVQIFEGLPAGQTWNFALNEPTETYHQNYAALLGVPHKYSSAGLRVDRSNPFLVRLWAKVEVAESTRLLMRAKNAARLYIDGKQAAETKFMSRNASGHEGVPPLQQGEGLIPPPPAEHHDVKVAIEAGEHILRWDLIVGGKGMRPEVGRPVLAIEQGDSFYFLRGDAHSSVPFTDNGWRQFVGEQRDFLAALNDRNRHSETETTYWKQRHEYARNVIENRVVPPAPTRGYPANNAIDHFINQSLAEKEIKPAELTSDYEFARRVSLDLVGLLPTAEQLAAINADDNAWREKLVDDLLNDPSWADNWVGYWQDVFAENPGILKPKLNNTGPFRYWIHESFRDNKPVDRIATELIMMQGSRYGGGPGGFALATQNDVPFAAKAHVVGAAFLGVELKCARCHDAPFHTHMQEDLFNMAAMLSRQPIELPKSSTVPPLPGGREPAVEISLAPGDKIEPHFPFEQFIGNTLPDELLRNPSDTREQLAASVTSPHNQRFAQVIVNRLWKRYLGTGFVEPVGDWESGSAAHPALMAFLAQELIAHDYDLKHIARLIVTSHVYQCQAQHHASLSEAQQFAAPTRRRMSAEQIIDSLYYAIDKPFRCETLTLDPEGRRPPDAFLNLGSPLRAWEFTSLSNERDRPALALPVAQNFVDFLLTFGWRDARPDPLTKRESAATVLQSLQMANGLAAARIAQLSDDNSLTDLFCEEQSLEQLVRATSLRLLSRPPTESEAALFTELLREGYDDRIVPGAEVPADHGGPRRTAVSWANHLSAEATRTKLELEQAARQGDRPTARLREDWRMRAEDMIWAMINSPEFVFVP